MIFLDRQTVEELLLMRDAIDLGRDAMCRQSAGEVRQPVRTVIDGADMGIFGSMPAQVISGPHAGFGLKAVVVKHDNSGTHVPSHLGVIVLFDEHTGIPSAIIDATSITMIRTAAVSAVATDVLARTDAGDLAILGTGAQARAHIEALSLVRPIRRVRVWGRSPARIETLRAWVRDRLNLDVEPHSSVDDATRGADLICTTTAAKEPILMACSVAPGAHINAVGACQPGSRELSADLVQLATVFVDSREAALAEADELRVPMREGMFGPEKVAAELGELLLGRSASRTGDNQITLYESVGLAVQDLVAARYVLDKAKHHRTFGQNICNIPDG